MNVGQADTAKVTSPAATVGRSAGPRHDDYDGLMISAEEAQITDSPTQSPPKPKGPRVGWDINHRYSCSRPWLWIAGNREQLSAIRSGQSGWGASRLDVGPTATAHPLTRRRRPTITTDNGHVNHHQPSSQASGF